MKEKEIISKFNIDINEFTKFLESHNLSHDYGMLGGIIVNDNVIGEYVETFLAEKKAAEEEAAEAKRLEQEAAERKKKAMAEMLINVLPDIAGKISEPLKQIDKITIIGGGDSAGSGVGDVAGNVPAVMAKLFESMKETVGIDLSEVVKAGTYDAKVNRNVNITGLENGADAVKDEVTSAIVDSTI